MLKQYDYNKMEHMTCYELRNLCREKKIKGYTKLKKQELIDILNRKSNEPINNIKKSIPKRIRDILWMNTFNTIEGTCYTCETPIDITNFEAGHIIAVSNGGSNELTNLRPVCSACNKSMGTQNMEDFKKYFNRLENLSSNKNECFKCEKWNNDIILLCHECTKKRTPNFKVIRCTYCQDSKKIKRPFGYAPCTYCI